MTHFDKVIFSDAVGNKYRMPQWVNILAVCCSVSSSGSVWLSSAVMLLFAYFQKGFSGFTFALLFIPALIFFTAFLVVYRMTVNGVCDQYLTHIYESNLIAKSLKAKFKEQVNQ